MTSSDVPADGLRGHMAAMDDTDRMIVEALRADGRMSMRALADQIQISRASAYARGARLARDAVSLRDTVLTRLQEIPEVHSTQTVLIFEEATPVQHPHDLPR